MSVFAVDILNIRKNSQLQDKVNSCAELHRQLLGIVIEQEDMIGKDLDILYEELWNNKVEKLIMQISEMDKCGELKSCPLHSQVLSEYISWQSELGAKVKSIKRKQTNISNRMKEILDVDSTNCDCGDKNGE